MQGVSSTVSLNNAHFLKSSKNDVATNSVTSSVLFSGIKSSLNIGPSTDTVTFQRPKATPVIRFGADLTSQELEIHDQYYLAEPEHNGSKPDRFVQAEIRKRFPDSKNTRIWEIGCGNGRNLLPLAEGGYEMMGSEFCEQARQQIQDHANAHGLKGIVTNAFNVTKTNLPSFEKPFQAALMVHITPYQSTQELKQSLQNIHDRLQKGGVVIFDALVRQARYTPTNPLEDQHSGCSNFALNDIYTAVKDSGFRLKKAVRYDEKGGSRPEYADYTTWGGKNPDPKLGGDTRPVTSTWFVLQK